MCIKCNSAFEGVPVEQSSILIMKCPKIVLHLNRKLRKKYPNRTTLYDFVPKNLQISNKPHPTDNVSYMNLNKPHPTDNKSYMKSNKPHPTDNKSYMNLNTRHPTYNYGQATSNKPLTTSNKGHPFSNKP